MQTDYIFVNASVKVSLRHVNTQVLFNLPRVKLHLTRYAALTCLDICSALLSKKSF